MGERQRHDLESVPQFLQGWPGGTRGWALGQQKQQLGWGQAGVKVLCGGKLSPLLARYYGRKGCRRAGSSTSSQILPAGEARLISHRAHPTAKAQADQRLTLLS